MYPHYHHHHHQGEHQHPYKITAPLLITYIQVRSHALLRFWLLPISLFLSDIAFDHCLIQKLWEGKDSCWSVFLGLKSCIACTESFHTYSCYIEWREEGRCSSIILPHCIIWPFCLFSLSWYGILSYAFQFWRSLLMIL